MGAATAPIRVDIDKLYRACGTTPGGRAINRELFERVVAYFATGVRAQVTDVRDATGVLINHVGSIVNQLTDHGYLRVYRGCGGRKAYRKNTFMLVTTPEYEPLYQTEEGPRPENLSEEQFPRWGDNIAPLIEAFGGYSRRLK